MTHLLDFVLHIDQHLLEFVNQYGTWVYGILFAIVFAETGFVDTPFLPGDSLLFAVGALSATGVLNPWLSAIRDAVTCGLGQSTNGYPERAPPTGRQRTSGSSLSTSATS